MNISDSMVLSLQSVKLFAYHGVYEEEHKKGNTFEIDLNIEIPLPKGVQSDRLEDTTNYADIAKCITTVSESKQYALLEAFAHDICQKIFSEYPEVLLIEIEVRKLNPPIPAMMKSVAVKLLARR